MSKTDELELCKIPNERYRKFFEKFKEIESLPVEQWKPEHILVLRLR